MNPSIEALERGLATLISNRKATAAALGEEVTAGDATLASFTTAPDVKAIAKAKAACASITGATALLVTLGDERTWIANAQSRWASDHFEELTTQLEALLAESVSHRNDYRKRGAQAVGDLSVKLVMREGESAPDVELEKINDEIARIEDDLYRADNRRDVAQRHVETFVRSLSDDAPGRPAFDSREMRFTLWERAIAAVREVSFEQPETNDETNKS
jgi:hypothetical protein